MDGLPPGFASAAFLEAEELRGRLWGTTASRNQQLRSANAAAAEVEVNRDNSAGKQQDKGTFLHIGLTLVKA